MKLPMRFRILHLISEKENISEMEIMDILKDEYGSEGQCNKSIIDSHLASMKAVGIIEVNEIYLDQYGNLKRKYKISESGLSRLKYLPDSWKAV